MVSYALLYDDNRLYLPLQRFLKRALDISGAAVGLIFLSPLFLVIAIMVRSDRGPVFFIQKRIGKNGRIFSCYKFRSMDVDAEETLAEYIAANPSAAATWEKFQKLEDDIGVTWVGRFMRPAGIDELPQLLNVLMGDMSLVGPRPITPKQQKYYGKNLVFYDAMRPGITGLWQVSGRNERTFAERIQLECRYVREWNLWLDMTILLRTIPVILKSNASLANAAETQA